MSFVSEFKEFAIKGNVVDMAVGVIIGGAFGKIVTSVINDLITPVIGLLVGGMPFKELRLVLQSAAEGKSEVAISYGAFLQTTFDFLIISWVIFLAIKAINKMKKPQPIGPAAPAPLTELELLAQIRDLLKK